VAARVKTDIARNLPDGVVETELVVSVAD